MRAAIRSAALYGVRALLAIGLCCAAARASPPPLASIDVPLLKIGVQPWINVDIGTRQDVHCIVDSGATMGVLPGELLQGAEYLRSARVVTANGAVSMPIMRVSGLVIGNVHLPATEFYRRDRNWFNPAEPMPCILGLNFMRGFTIDFDGHAQRLRLFARGTPIDAILGELPPSGAHLNVTIADDGPIRLETAVGDIRTQSQIDTGWGLATPNATLLDLLDIHAGDPRIVSRLVTDSISAQPRTLPMIELRDVHIGNVLVHKAFATIGESSMRVIDKETRPYLHIGWAILADHRLILDLADHDIALLQ